MYLRPPLHVERASERQEISVPFAASLGPQITAFERFSLEMVSSVKTGCIFFQGRLIEWFKFETKV